MDDRSIVFTNATFSYEKKIVLNKFDLSISKGQIYSLVGKSGSGKTTLLKVLSGELDLSSGDVTGLTGSTSIAHQFSPLFPWLTVAENLNVCCEKSLNMHEVKSYLKLIGLESNYRNKPFQLSGGMKSRLVLLRAFISQPDLVLLDEPFNSLDIITKKEMHNLIFSLTKKFDSTVVIATHDLEEALLLAKETFVLKSDTNGVKAKINNNKYLVGKPSIDEYKQEIMDLI